MNEPEKANKTEADAGHSASTMLVQITTDKTGPKLICPICSKAVISLNGYMKHMKKHEPPGGFCCNYCDDRFCLEELLKKHKDQKHKILACQICHATFPTADEYRTHIKDVHQGVDRPMAVCKTCGVEFKTAQAAKRHKDTNCGQIKPHPCDECPMAFYTKYNLAEHKKIHKGEKKFCCSYCGKSFLSNGRLVIHERSHTGEKPYKCDVCGKCFAHRESIVTHSSIHTGIKLVACKCCGARFSCHSNLIKHRRTRQDTCGLPIYDSTKETKRSRNSRIPASLMSSEIKIVRASKVINPNEEQKKQTKASKDLKKINSEPELKKTDSEIELKKSDSEPEVKKIDSTLEIKKTDSELEHIKTDSTQELKKTDSKTELKKTDSTLDLQKSASALKIKKFDSDLELKKTDLAPETKKTDSEQQKVQIDTQKDVTKPPRRSQRIETKTSSTESENKTPADVESDSDDYADRIFDSSSDSDDSDQAKHQAIKSPAPTATTVKTEEEFKPPEPDIFAEKDRLLDHLLSDVVPVKAEPPDEVKDESPDEKKTKLSSLKPCRVLIQQANIQNPKLQPSMKTKLKFKRHRLALREKLRFFKKDRVYDCQFCMKVYHIRKPYEKHLVEQHKKTNDEVRAIFLEEDNDIPSDLVHRCPICSKVYLMAKRLKTHITYHGPDGTLIHKCPCYCKHYFSTKEEAMEHAKVKHKSSIHCGVCDKYVQSPEALKTHKRSHIKRGKQTDRNLICDKCAKSFVSRTSLNDHTRSNCGKNPLYHCSICDKKFTTAGILKTHSLLHQDETPYVCDKCGKAFKIQSQYKTHLRHKHSEDKPYKCELCPKQYPYRESLLTHMAIHTGLKRYSCNGCSKRFTCISNLQAHRKVYADTCGLQPLNSKPSQYIGMQKGHLLMGTKPTF